MLKPQMLKCLPCVHYANIHSFNFSMFVHPVFIPQVPMDQKVDFNILFYNL